MIKQLYLCGLGNPGRKYRYNRHNVGYLFVDYLKEKLKAPEWKKFESSVEFSSSLEKKVFLIKPIEFMNNSGKSLKVFLDYIKLDIKDVIVVYDDVDIEIGEVRIRKTGSGGSHNGMRDIISAFKTQNIPRIRIGIGPKPLHMDLKDFVLSNFSEDEKNRIFEVFEYISSFVFLIPEKGLDYVISRYNRKL